MALAASGTVAVLPASAQTAFETIDRTAQADVSFSSGERGKPILAGSVVTVTGEKFRPNQKVTLLYGTNPLPGGELTADAEGKVSTRITLPANAAPGIHPIMVVAQAPYSASIAELKVSPTVPLAGQGNYTLTHGEVARGLYQSAYSTKNNTLFVASAVGRPPVGQSEILKLNADTLAVLARVTPAEAPMPERRGGRGTAAGEPSAAPAKNLFAVYGIGVDDAKGTVWVTNSRQNTVAVYRQSDLSLIKQFAPGTVNHARDVIVDPAAGKAYSSATFQPEVVVFDTGTLEVAKRIAIRSGRRGGNFSAASLSFDAGNGKLYVVSNATDEVAVIDTRTQEVTRVLPVPGAKSAIGVSHDPQTGRIFVAAQGTDNLVVLDGNSGAVVADTPVGAGALNVVFDPVKRRAYVATRGAGTIAVADADGRIVANLGPAPMANHVSLGKNGTVYAVDKSAGVRNAENDTILKIVPRK
ncbi:MAG: hypothetical protein DI632_13820 [Sphingomonas hengshuiensis]|uniref:Uncharacterized protein n=2 Tax=Sphingomonas TaxID=13687 RepID=A0A2W4YX39_9SPHN|nr:MAG: hypothetical protein DI632_13820 [Sphingomonas hengshuiensis]